MLLHDHTDFSSFIGIVAAEKAIREAIIEKDYWVTYVLHELRNSEFKDEFIFKGGTSLSKGWNLLDRFSEDIDLLLIRGTLSKAARKERLKQIEKFVGKLPSLTFERDNEANRSGTDSRTACFKYQSITPLGSYGTLLPFIKLEMGYRGGREPMALRPIQSLLGEALSLKSQTDLARNILPIEMPLLHPKRTLVEKLFAIHSAYESGEILGKIRHYYDVYRLLELEDVLSFLGSQEYIELKSNVAEFSKENWPNSPIPPGLKLSDISAFAPEAKRLREIETEYSQSDIYYGKKPVFNEVLDRIQKHKNNF